MQGRAAVVKQLLPGGRHRCNRGDTVLPGFLEHGQARPFKDLALLFQADLGGSFTRPDELLGGVEEVAQRDHLLGPQCRRSRVNRRLAIDLVSQRPRMLRSFRRLLAESPIVVRNKTVISDFVVIGVGIAGN